MQMNFQKHSLAVLLFFKWLYQNQYLQLSLFNNIMKQVSITRILKFSYVNSGPIKKIKEQAIGKSWWEWIKAELKVGKLLVSEGYKQSKTDISYFMKYFNQQRTPQINQRIYEISANLWKLPPIALLFCLPMGLPFMLAYMAFLPALTPTWFHLDTYGHKYDEKKKKKQIEALQYFKDIGSIRQVKGQQNKRYETSLNMTVFSNMSLPQKKRVHELCFGEAFDGTNIIRKQFRVNLEYFISSALSSYILQRNLQRRLQNQEVSQTNKSDDLLTQKVLKQVQKIEAHKNESKNI